MSDELSQRDWITTKEAADLGGYADPSAIQYAAMRGAFRAEKAEGTWLIYKPDFLRWMEEKTHGLRTDKD